MKKLPVAVSIAAGGEYQIRQNKKIIAFTLGF